MMVNGHRKTGANYRAQLADIIRRAEALEIHARNESHALDAADPERITWLRIAQHLLLIHDWITLRRRPLFRLRRYLNLL
jgi:hypothetical protein